MQELTVKGIHKSLNTNGYICDVPFAARITSAMQTKPVSGAFLYGPAGTGKSYLPIVLSKTLGVEMFFYQCAPGTREDDLVLTSALCARSGSMFALNVVDILAKC
jgi:hypothetical protein